MGFQYICLMRMRYQGDQLVQGCCFVMFAFLIFPNQRIYIFIITIQILQYTQVYMKINQQQHRKIDIDDRGNPIMTLKTVKYYCYKDNLFQTPQLNQKLYLHYKGFKKIQHLQHYPNLITIWLNNNCISKIEGLNTLTNLICLYLNNNVISKIQNLEKLDKLSVLHLAHNRIDKVEGLGQLKALNILNLSQNFLATPQSIHGLTESKTLTSIDLSKNQLQNSTQLFNIICSMDNITCLCMKNTPISKIYKNYRKKLIGALTKLKYLDDRPVKQIDHRLAQAWIKGGPDLQNQQRNKIVEQREVKNNRENKLLSQKVKRQKKKQQQIAQLQQQKRLLQTQLQQTSLGNNLKQKQQTQQQLQQINRRLQILKDGPKGFQASITQTQIKILHVKQQQQQKIINKYFYSQKLKIQQNLSKIVKQKVDIRQVNLKEDQKRIENKIRNVLGLNIQCQNKYRDSSQSKWESKYEPILQALLEKQKYNFQHVLPQFNKILADIGRKMLKKAIKFELRQLEYIWTSIYLSRLPQQAGQNQVDNTQIN